MRIANNALFASAPPARSSFFIPSNAGAILIDSGEPESVPPIRTSIEKPGHQMFEIKILRAGHAHYDHIGGHAEIKRLSGAKVYVMDADREAFQSGVDRSALGAQGWAPVAIDRVLKDGDTRPARRDDADGACDAAATASAGARPRQRVR